jgi:hypothetical protein
MVQVSPGFNMRPYLKKQLKQRVVERLPSKHEALSSNPVPQK